MKLESTIIQLLQRLYDSNGGCIFIDGQDIKTLDVAWLRSQIGIVSQEPALFTGTIEENIRMGKPDATDDEVIAAARMAHAHDFITDLCNVSRLNSCSPVHLSLFFTVFRTTKHRPVTS